MARCLDNQPRFPYPLVGKEPNSCSKSSGHFPTCAPDCPD
ncbi:hypothetical protein Bhyg_03238 [Pseudolycoriella hygida]|uniref:Uncharacterized protein n=1 Tax=Pseudolycoriella hygida TaxID=35572 RepID=A0A9Q0NDA7_9DIPT|nr:hypothetical protein Bhyg_03238 [Pseudolycoriella hygida]